MTGERTSENTAEPMAIIQKNDRHAFLPASMEALVPWACCEKAVCAATMTVQTKDATTHAAPAITANAITKTTTEVTRRRVAGAVATDARAGVDSETECGV